MEWHRLAQAAAYGNLGGENPALTGPRYQQRADPVNELQLEKADVRLVDVLNSALK